MTDKDIQKERERERPSLDPIFSTNGFLNGRLEIAEDYAEIGALNSLIEFQLGDSFGYFFHCHRARESFTFQPWRQRVAHRGEIKLIIFMSVNAAHSNFSTRFVNLIKWRERKKECSWMIEAIKSLSPKLQRAILVTKSNFFSTKRFTFHQ